MLTSLLIELTPGPNMAWLAAVALSKGRRPALMAVAGVALGLFLLGCIAALGLGAIVAATPWLYQTIRGFGFLYLLWLAWETWRPPAENGEDDFGSFRDGLVANLLNPKAGMFYIAILPAFLDPSHGFPLAQTLLFVVVYVAVATAVHATIVIFAARAREALAARQGVQRIRRLLALGLVAVALWFLWST
jgi:threonine/homoserine/homoserine lactone efflux protein